ncbi:ATP-dependent helicase [Entomospira culicis]|uniref:DNA 3'-5' helicase n=1 Tax=Entomospira culicis TaxID=2719989 RepID=A0A968KVG3_9SPIO|nr:UvrD-helicase domain-containing protein [Entomospira culicis]NIZ18868.1 UvrD-helicase domain-containing protein [Entomospira culicis]NIZ69083.1 UvrD-helicase domain-containing protein [Entomospira culicis]WDI37670.1 3'-5' exonuclease [Entomospira culicis]WDI39298.1 3'-5' exonuclease [Entomospira culicis]
MHLNKTQILAVEESAHRLLIIAGAGTGKTAVITQRIAYLTQKKGIPSRDILALTFTNKAAKEMQIRAISIASELERTTFTTFHSFGAKFLREYGKVMGLYRYFTIYDDQDQLALLKRLYPSEPKKQLLEWRHLINKAKDYALSLEELDNYTHNIEEFRAMFDDYQQTLRANQAVDFGDLILLPLQILEQYPLIKAEQEQRWHAILVDEYQDTNRTQSALLQKLVGKATYLTVVGDEDQSIYAFRGADTTAILEFDTIFPETKMIKLEQNYRSHQHILHIANYLIDKNINRLGKRLFTENSSQKPVEFHTFTDEIEETKWIINQIKANALYKNRTTAILYRTNAQSRIFEKYLTQEQIPYKLVGAMRFFEREEIKTAIAGLTLLINPYDTVAFRRILTTPSRGVGAKSIEKIEDLQKELKESSLIDSAIQAKLPSKARVSIEKIALTYQALQNQLEENSPLKTLLATLLHELELFQHYQEKDQEEGSDRLENLQELLSALSFYPTGKDGLIAFLESLQLNQQPEEDQEQTTLNLITIHNTKGLEYDCVFLTGMEQHLFPKINTHSRNIVEELEEERRLCYVAITRAREELYVTHAQQRTLYGERRYQQPSQFLQEAYLSEDVTLHHHDVEAQNNGDHIYYIGRWVRDEEYGVGKILKTHHTRAGHLTLTIQFKERIATFFPQFRQLEPIVFDGLEEF